MNPTRGGWNRKHGRRLVLEGRVVPFGGERRRIVIDGGRIADIAAPTGAGDLVLDDGHLIFPGFVDPHVHAREDPSEALTYKESFESAGRAAIRGGVVAFADMPNTPVPPVDHATYSAKEQLAARCPVDVLLFAGVGPDTGPLRRNVPYKAYLGPTTGTTGLGDADEARAALEPYRGLEIAFHAESGGVLRRAGDPMRGGGLRKAEEGPPQAETEGIDLALRLAREFSLRPHIAHISTAEGLERIRAARSAGQAVTCEVTPNHLFFDRRNRSMFPRGAWLTMNPPLREPRDRAALIDGLADGTVDWVATDHAPHLPEEKEQGAAGVPGLDTVGGFAAWLLARGVPAERVAEAFSTAPGAFFERYRPEGWGRIEPGAVGSLTVLHLGAPWVVGPRDLRTRCGWSPFEGVELPGDAGWTIVRGRIYRSSDP